MDFKKLVPHLIAFLVLLVVAFARFAPVVFEGKALQQGDNLQALGMQQESREVEAKTGEYPLWTNSAFSGMPTYQILYPTSNPMKYVQKLLLLGNDMAPPHTGILLMMLGVYLLLVVMKVDWRLSLIGAVGFGLAANHMDLVQAGHSTKVIAAAYCAPILAGMILTFRGKYWLGGGLTALFVALQIYANHIQITYYFFLSLLIFGVVYLIDAVKKGWLPRFGTAVAVSAVAVLLAAGTNASRLMTTKEYADETIRGKSELTKKDEGSSGSSAEEGGGLSKTYAFQYSYGIAETWNLLIPNYLGGSSSVGFASDPESETIAALRQMKNSEEAMQYAQKSGHYWGGQPFVGGGVYMGMVFTLLFFMGMFLVKNPIKWYVLGTLILSIMISWGSNFSVLNYALFDHFPMFNKFRDPKMFLIIANMLVVAFGIMGLQAFFDKKTDAKTRQNGLLLGGVVTVGLLVIGFLISLGFDYQKPGDDLPKALADAIAKDRAALLQADFLRSLFYAAVPFGLLWFWMKKSFSANILTILIGLIAVVDVWGIGARMLSSEDYIDKSQKNAQMAPTAGDDEISKDKDPHFRVADFRRGLPFSNAFTSFHHESVGGYHAAKLMRYQELIENYLNDPKNQQIYGMLNTKYFINQQDKALTNPSACGNAWFVQEVKTVANGDEEIAALAGLNPKTQAVVQEAFASSLKGFTPQFDSTASIQLTHYHPDTMIYKYTANGDQFAVFSEVYYPPSKGWKMFLDGKPTDDFIKCNFLLRGAKLPAGQHEVKMIFAPKSYYSGETITLIAGLLVLALSVWGLVWFARKYQLPDANNLPEAEKQEHRPVAQKTVKTEPRRKK